MLSKLTQHSIKQLIILFYKIYEQKDNNAIFLIEEPELNLHPGFQRKFIEIITKEFPKHQFFITTHSNHIIDLYNEQDNISVYKFRNSNHLSLIKKEEREIS